MFSRRSHPPKARRLSKWPERVSDGSLPRKELGAGLPPAHPELKARRVKAVDWKRHDHNIYDKTQEWHSVMEKELHAPTMLQEIVYNMDETGTLLSASKSLRVLVGRDDLRNYRGAGVQRTLVTAIECISADGHSLDPLIIWPAPLPYFSSYNPATQCISNQWRKPKLKDPKPVVDGIAGSIFVSGRVSNLAVISFSSSTKAEASPNALHVRFVSSEAFGTSRATLSFAH